MVVRFKNCWTCLLLLGAFLPGCQPSVSDRSAVPTGAVAAPGAKPPALAGTASCSGRACHGSLTAQPATVARDEFVTWSVHDKHAQAYAVLVGEQGRTIARNLKIPGAKGEEDVRCLACHTNPLAAASSGLAQERLFGVGCESCHGSAVKWLGPHTGQGWKSLTGQQKRDQGMNMLSDLATTAQTCAGCHVGEPADTAHRPWTDAACLPARDLNHDLYAAGHPRLNFEFGSFLANLPRHWKPKEHEPTYEARVWAVGQVVSAQMALQLLADRAGNASRPWPEFAEHDCYACHHDLREPSWRQQREHYGRRLPGSLPPNEWYYVMLPELADGKVPASLDAVQSLLGKPFSDRSKVAQQARDAAGQLDPLLRQVQQPYDRAVVRQLLQRCARQGAKPRTATWDGATQLCLALFALNDASGGDRPTEQTLRQLAALLAFGPGRESPRLFRFRERFDEELQDLLKRIAP